jgi:hypothetical protein
MKCKFVITVAFSTVFLLSAVRAEEGGSGHYMPGMTASFIDALPGKPGLAAGRRGCDHSVRLAGCRAN